MSYILCLLPLAAVYVVKTSNIVAYVWSPGEPRRRETKGALSPIGPSAGSLEQLSRQPTTHMNKIQYMHLSSFVSGSATLSPEVCFKT